MYALPDAIEGRSRLPAPASSESSVFFCITCAERFPIGQRFPQGRCVDCYVLATVGIVREPLGLVDVLAPGLS